MDNNIKTDLREIGVEGLDWIKLAQDRNSWRATVNTVQKLSASIKGGEILDYLKIPLASEEGLCRMSFTYETRYNSQTEKMSVSATHTHWLSNCPPVFLSTAGISKLQPSSMFYAARCSSRITLEARSLMLQV
jgi:hypothetical protein